MKRMLALASIVFLGSVPTVAGAEYWDVIGFQLKSGCTMQKYLGIVADFQKWGAAHGYSARIAVPVQSEDVSIFYWEGTAKDAATFGAAWDAWRNAQADANSVPAKLAARFGDCSVNKTRSGYDVY